MANSLKILVLNNRLPFPLNDGGNIATYYFLKNLHSIGHEVHLFCLNTNKHRHSVAPVEEICTAVHTFNINTDIRPLKALKSLFQQLPYNAQRFYNRACAEQLASLLKTQKFDLIQLEGPYMFVYQKTIGKYSQCPIFLRSHNIEHRIWERQARNEQNPFKRLYLKNLARKIKRFELETFPKMRAHIAISEEDEQYFKAQFSEISSTFLPAGIDFSTYLPKEKNKTNPPTLCFLGSLEWSPNQQGLSWFLEKILPLIQAEKPAVELHVAGKNPPDKWKNHQQKGYIFHGMVADAHAFLNEHDILIVPLLSGSGMRIKIIEAMALKKCIVSTTIGAEGIPILPQKEILIADNPNEFALKIIELLNNRAKIEEIRENAYAFVRQNYDWQQLIQKFVTFYSKHL